MERPYNVKLLCTTSSETYFQAMTRKCHGLCELITLLIISLLLTIAAGLEYMRMRFFFSFAHIFSVAKQVLIHMHIVFR